MQEKSSSYECFHAHDDIVTVAVFAPETAWLPVGPSAVPSKAKVPDHPLPMPVQPASVHAEIKGSDFQAA